jgi:hypothetical protein
MTDAKFESLSLRAKWALLRARDPVLALGTLTDGGMRHVGGWLFGRVLVALLVVMWSVEVLVMSVGGYG